MKHENETDRPALGVVRGDNCCLIIDSGNSPKHAREFRKEIEALHFPPVKYVVATHHHWDHVFGLEEWKEAITIANVKTYEYMKTYCDLTYDDLSLEKAIENKIFLDFSVKAMKAEIEDNAHFHPINFNVAFQGELTIDLGGVTCLIKEIMSPHTDDSTIIFVPEEKTMFLGDCVYGYISQGYNYFNRELTEKMISNIEQYKADYYLISHEPICTREEIKTYWKQLQMGAAMTKYSNNLDEAVLEFKKAYGKEPTNEELFFIKSFGVGEGWGRTGKLEPRLF